MTLYLTHSTQLYEDFALTQPQRKSVMGDRVRVLECRADGEPPGDCNIFTSHARLAWYRENGRAIAQIGEPGAVGFAEIPLKHLTDVPF